MNDLHDIVANGNAQTNDLHDMATNGNTQTDLSNLDDNTGGPLHRVVGRRNNTMDSSGRSHAREINDLHDMAANGNTETDLSNLDDDTGGLLHRVGRRNNTALHVAILSQQKHIARALVEQGASLTILNADGDMPITYCSNGEMLEMLLLTSDAFLHSPETWNTDTLGRSILHYAAIHLKEATSVPLISKLVSVARSEHLLLRDKDGATFLGAAAKSGNIRVVEALKGSIMHAIDPETQKALINREVGMSALMEGHRDFFDQLLELSKVSSADVQLTLGYLLEKLKKAALQKLEDDVRKDITMNKDSIRKELKMLGHLLLRCLPRKRLSGGMRGALPVAHVG